MTYETPDNLVELLDGAVRAAARTAFYAPILGKRPTIGNLDEFGGIPLTPLESYRKQRLADVLAEPSGVEWIVGPLKGHSPASVAVAEGADEAEDRYDLLTDAVKSCISLDSPRTCAVVTSGDRRYFAAEIATILIRSGVPSHVFVDRGDPRTYERLHNTSPDLLVVLSDRLAEAELPPSIELCITFRRSQKMVSFPQLDVYVVDELGFLGHSTDCETFALYNDVCYFETSDNGNLVVTALHNRVRPMVRVETLDRVDALGTHTLTLAELSPIA